MPTRASKGKHHNGCVSSSTNLVIFHTLVTMSEALQRMADAGHQIDRNAAAHLSPYQTEYINRFGEYELKRSQEIASLEPALNITLFEDLKVPLGI